jgi:hypothetical protein
MPSTLKIIFDQFLELYSEKINKLKSDRDTMLDLYLYFSAFMDNEIKTKKNKYDRTKYSKLKKFGLTYIKDNSKQLLRKVKEYY